MPVPGQGQAHFKADGVVLSVTAPALVHAALHQAMRGQGLARHLRGRLGLRAGQAGVLELKTGHQRLAALQVGAHGRAEAGRGRVHRLG